MKRNLMLATLVLISSFLLTSCQALGNLIGASMWAGAIIVIIIIALVLWLINKMRK